MIGYHRRAVLGVLRDDEHEFLILGRGASVVKARVERVEDRENARLVHVEVDAPMVKQYLDEAFHKLRRDVEVPGFRKGRVPRVLFERHYGDDLIWEEALEEMVHDAYMEALEELELNPIALEGVDVEEREKTGVTFTATIEVMPEAELGEYRDFDLNLDIDDVTDEDVDEVLHSFRESRASITPAEGDDVELSTGMLAVIDYEGYIDGELRNDLVAEEAMLEIGTGDIPGLEEGLLGCKAGDSKTIVVEMPDDFPTEELRGEEVAFEVDVKEIKIKELPELNDDFAREEFDEDNVEDLRETMKEQLTYRREQEALNAVEEQAIAEAVSNAEVEAPEVMVERLIDERVSQFEQRLDEVDMELEEYVEMQGFESIAEFRDQYREAAEEDIRRMLVLKAIADAEEIEVTEEDQEEELARRAAATGIDVDMFRRAFSNPQYLESMQDDLQIRKTREALARWSCPEFDEVKKRSTERQERWQQERQEEMQRVAEAEAQAEADDPEDDGDVSAKDEPSGEA